MRRLKGLLALLVIVGVTVGLPFALVAVGADPFAGGAPSFESLVDLLTSRDDGTLFMVVLQVVGWLAWAFLALSILVELVSQLRGVRAPRMPGLQLPQSAARGLVGAMLLLFTAVPMANAAVLPASAAPIVESHTVSVSAPAVVEAPSASATHRAESTHRAEQAAEKKVAPATVQHTVVRGDTLWGLAETYLGDGHRFRDIVELNQEHLADNPAFLTTGWVLTIPASPDAAPDAAEQDTRDRSVVVEKGDTLSGIAAAELGDAARYPELFEATRDVDQPGGAHLTDPDLIHPGWTVQVPGASGAAPAQEHRAAPEARATEPEAAELEASEPDASEPKRSAPAEQADPVQPAAQELAPEASAPEASAPEAGAPSSAEATRVGDETERPKAAPAPGLARQGEAAAERQADAVQSDAVQSDAVQSDAVQSDAVQSDAVQSDAADDGMSDDAPWQVATVAGVGTVLAAGVLTVLARRRRDQQRLRRPGQRVPLPVGDTAAFEQAIRAAADHLSVETVDLALRSLASLCVESGRPLPVVRAARLTAQAFELYLEEPTLLPQPWRNAGDSTVWRLDVADVQRLAPVDPAVVPAPYPSLVTIGSDDDQGHVFLNLEHLGALGITGDDPATREILAALAVELATSVWADDLQVTLVGAFPDLEDTMRTGRIRYLPSIGRIIEDLTRRAHDDRAALAAQRVPDLYAARVAGVAPDAWSPEIVLLADQVSDEQRAQLARLTDDLPHVALATITGGTSVGEWSVQLLPGQELAVLAPIGLELRPQRLPSDQYGHLLRLVSLADAGAFEGVGQSEPSVAEVEAIAPVSEPRTDTAEIPIVAPLLAEPVETADPYDDEPAPDTLEVAIVPDPRAGAAPSGTAPRILALGPVDLQNAAGTVEDGKRARLLELATFLALHPGTTRTAIDAAIWPDRAGADNLSTRNAATSRLRRWVGQDADGQDYLPRHQADGGHGFLPSVTTDAGEWDHLLGGAPLDASTENLEAALPLVRGVPFEGTHTRRYAWAEPIRQRLIAEIVDASYTLARRRLLEGRWRSAEAAVVVGLRVEPTQESLWRVRILAAHESRDAEAETEAIERLLSITERLECDLQPETEQLLAALKNPGAGFDRLMVDAL
ncbi:transcriptional activator [Promicromonospora sp. AC04]|uniref:LysM peptidoglycan-binding domain-containing protein n=1 Tax=Promicromonospora sp. AC04 TaxID=2135723 RepID=UPI000D33E0B0|nr:LysM peptidoglycan-binding domain-containing protein [Promicromonospora sp. AC04]PUB29045.1 transcriptional activator [Promicromonospora sp. AC04]